MIRPAPPRSAPPRAQGPSQEIVFLGIVFCAVLYLWNSWERDFWAPDEPDFAEVTREMEAHLEKGDLRSLLTPTLGGEPYFEKPPLIYWSALASRFITGADPRLAYRVPVALAVVLSLWVTYLAGRRFFDGRVAAVACLIQASSFIHYHCGSWFLTDMLFASTCGLAVIALGINLLWEPGSLRWALIGWTALSVAALSKSVLLAPALVLGPLLLFILLKRGGPGVGREILGLRPLWGLVIFLALVSPWYIYMYLEHGQVFLQEHIIGQHFSRLSEADSHKHGFFYYFATLPADFLPWSFFIPLAVFWGRVRFRHSGPRFFMIWMFFTFFFLSCISSKQGKYLLPMWPALSLLVAAALLSRERESIWEGFLGEGLLRILSWGFKAPLAVAVALVAYGLCGFDFMNLLGPLCRAEWEPDVRVILENRELLIKLGFLALLVGAAFYAAGVGIGRRLRGKARMAPAVAYLGAAILVGYLGLSFVFQDLNQFKSARALGEEVTRIVGKHEIAMYGRDRAAVHYYVGKPVKHLNRLNPDKVDSEEKRILDAYLSRKEKVYILMTEKERENLISDHPKYGNLLHVVRKDLRLGFSKRAVLVTN